jgi:hypothetical protein
VGIPWSGNVVSPWGRSGGTTPFDQLLERDESIPEGFFALNIMIEPIPVDAKQVANLPNTFITKDGKIWRNGKPKKVYVGMNGYKTCTFSINNKSNPKTVHRLLLETFVGPCPEKHEALHINGNRLDNRLENLRWGTRKENVADAIKHGTATIGTKNSQSKFNKENLNEIIKMKSQGMTAQQIADRFNVSKTTVYRVYSGKTYTKEI